MNGEVPPQWLKYWLKREDRGWAEWDPVKGKFVPVEEHPSLINDRPIT